jgi:Flp pilus assembly protein TadD
LRSKEANQKKLDWHLELSKIHSQDEPNNPRPHYETGVMQLLKANYEEAIKKFEKVISLNKGYKSVYYNIGEAYYRLGKPDKAEYYLNQSIEIKPQESAAYNTLAIIYQAKGMFKESIKLLLQAINIDKNNPTIYQTLGGVLVKVGKFKESIVILNEAIRLDPTDVGAYNNLGGAYAHLKDYENAIKFCKKSAELCPKNHLTLNNLAILYNLAGKPEEAKNLITALITKFPDNIAIKTNYNRIMNS